MNKIIMPNYNECITNLASSIMKYFELETNLSSIIEIDNLLEKEQPKNVVILLFDGMGLNIINRTLDSNSILRKNLIKGISSVAPATTTASTTSILSGLNPIEHGWLGWNLYIKPIDQIVTMFLNTKKDTEEQIAEYNVSRKFYPYKTITQQINETGKYSSFMLMPFGSDKYSDLDDMNQKIIDLCDKEGKKYIYAYYEDPDSTMHETGTDSYLTYKVINNINKKVEELCNKLNDTLVIVTADHGHINSDGILLTNYKDFFDTLASDIWIEGRLCTFKVKSDRKDEFEKIFNKYFSDDFILKTKEEVINMNLFGNGVENKYFRDSLGDYFALGITNKYFRYNENSVNLRSMHAGFTEDEMIIPLIKIKK